MDFLKEIELMKTIGHNKYIINMVGCSMNEEPRCLVIEYMAHGDLLNVLRKERIKVWLM